MLYTEAAERRVRRNLIWRGRAMGGVRVCVWVVVGGGEGDSKPCEVAMWYAATYEVFHTDTPTSRSSGANQIQA